MQAHIRLSGYCGDGIIDDATGETCDSGWQLNGTPGNACSWNCTSITCDYKCGNSVLEPGESCDHGENNGKDGDSCGADCHWVAPQCGDGVTQYPEECDDADLNGSEWSHCSKDCKWVELCGNPQPPSCGDGVLQYPELCDLGYLNGQPGSNVGHSTPSSPLRLSPHI